MPLTTDDLLRVCAETAAGAPPPDAQLHPERAAVASEVRWAAVSLGGYNPLLERLFRAAPQLLEAGLPAPAKPVSAGAWVQYKGPLGGKGWKHSVTGRVFYGDEQPGANERGVDPADVAATAAQVTQPTPAAQAPAMQVPPPGQTPLSQATAMAAPSAEPEKPAVNLANLFSAQENALPHPDVAKQPFTDQASIYASAVKAKETFDNTLDHGKGVDKLIGGRAVRPTNAQEFQAALDMTGPVVILPPLKGEKRAVEKVATKYGGDWSKIQDVVRATIAVDKIEQIPLAIKGLRTKMAEHGWAFAAQPEDRMNNPLPGGYRDVVLKLKSADGHIAELQINLKAMIKVKEGQGHKLYEQHRSIVANAQRAGRALTPQEQGTLKTINEQMAQVYDAAWKAAA